MILSAALLVTACSFSDNLMATIGLPSAETEPGAADMHAHAQVPMVPTPPRPVGQPGPLTVTDEQRGYLDELDAAGVRASGDLMALSIGSSVCQVRAAKQTDEAVWDFIMPLVRSDMTAADTGSAKPTASEVDEATAEYIRIATERLC